jgi:hypothetical protein
MVTPCRPNRSGSSTLGCLVSLLILVATVYYGFHVGEVYWRYFQLLDEMKVNARLSPGLTDDVIQRRLATKVQEVFGPSHELAFRISRDPHYRTVVIETQYRDSVSLPLFHRGFNLKPRAEEPI